MPINTWSRDWNNIIRNVIFPDVRLKELMMIPKNTKINTFIDKYFIKAGYTNAVLENENVRIVYSTRYDNETAAPNVKQMRLTFDIYVKHEHMHDATPDRLENRTELIANQIHRLLHQSRYLEGYRFWPAGEGDLGTRTIGYARYEIAFGYMRVY